MKRILMSAMLLFVGTVLADGTYPSTSIYQLPASLTNQSGVQHGLDVYAGHPVLVTMFYGSCAHTCPLLIETLRTIERAAPDARTLRVLMITVDPERDTPAALARIVKERHIDISRWTLAHADLQMVRKIAAVLSIQYKQTPDGEINHSSIISVLTPQGEVAQQSSVLGKADQALLDTLRTIRSK